MCKMSWKKILTEWKSVCDSSYNHPMKSLAKGKYWMKTYLSGMGAMCQHGANSQFFGLFAHFFLREISSA